MPKHQRPKRGVTDPGAPTMTLCRATYHAQLRATQRNISPADLAYVLKHGRRIRNTGAIFCFLGRRDLPACDCANQHAVRLIGTTAVIEGGNMITVYRNRNGLRTIKRKLKYQTSAQERAGRPAGPTYFPVNADDDAGHVDVPAWLPA